MFSFLKSEQKYCQAKGCNEMSNKSYCANHICKFDTEFIFNICNKSKVDGYSYCEDHKCQYVKCDNKKYYNECCGRHACYYSYGDHRCSKIKVYSFSYCDLHKCSINDCNNNINYSSETGLCQTHIRKMYNDMANNQAKLVD